jgi:sugar lactone lactonase YvrE
MAATDSVVTDSAGRFAFDTTIDTGTYVITSASGNNAVLIDSIAVKNKASTDTLAPDTLKPAGALKGVIKLSEGGDPRKVFVLAFGIDRFAKVNLDGSFKFGNLAEAKYDLRLISGLDNYGVLDTNAIPVRSADTTNLDTISLPFTGIPTPKNMRISYDTLKQIVTVTWSRADTALVKSYNVYRRNVDSNTVAIRINASPVADTIYRDSNGVQGTTYEYMVAAVNKSTTEGTKSAAVSLILTGAYVLIDSLGNQGSGDGQFQNPTGLALGNDSSVWVADVNNNRIEKFNFKGNFLAKLGVLGSDSGKFNVPVDIAVDPLGNIFVADQQNNKVQKFNNQQNWMASLDSGLSRPQCIAVDSRGNLYVNEITSPKIKKYDKNLHFIAEWGHTGNDSAATGSPQNIAVDSLDRIYVLDNSVGKIVVFDTLGQFVKTIRNDKYGNALFSNPMDLSIIHGEIFITAQMKIIEIDLNGNFLVKWGSNNFNNILALPNGEIWTTIYPNQKIYRFQKR